MKNNNQQLYFNVLLCKFSLKSRKFIFKNLKINYLQKPYDTAS